MEEFLAVLLLISTPALADYDTDDYYLKVGLNADTSHLVQNKFLAIGRQAPAFFVFDYQIEGGYLYENKNGSGFFGPSLGTSINTQNYYAKVFIGPEVVTSTDDHISTPFEFNTDVELGLRDARGVGIGVGYKHMSNGGLCNNCANLGLDFIYTKIQIP